MKAQAEIGAADHARILFGLEPAGPELNTPRRQPGEPALELHAPRAVSGDQDDEIGKPSSGRRRFPTANAVLEAADRVDHHVEILVLGPAGRTHDESADTEPHAETSEQSLTELLALHAIERHEYRGGPVVQDVYLLHAKTILDERRHTARHRQVRV